MLNSRVFIKHTCVTQKTQPAPDDRAFVELICPKDFPSEGRGGGVGAWGGGGGVILSKEQKPIVVFGESEVQLQGPGHVSFN